MMYPISKHFQTHLSRLHKFVQKEEAMSLLFLLVTRPILLTKRQVTTEEGDNKACEFGALFMETSAKDRFNIQPLFSKIGSALHRNEESCAKSSQAEHQLESSTKS
ncbi:PREDICTED: ras-related protein RABH1a-like [Camelina sativa]|uniref:Ras-related protein RABH1a-like n=1 Tax=Camelina sativa TaxID=90675 RepID=A0ABM0UQA0_CAMSA|nr:PREDICTED: ras-related protein RABH1a-like [Camelina sativa]XP_019087034.1 PREDICTED: ras-related protein RABH1a-like [Camelina sativa]XP_019087035.1 PREDICTED: ras-related protein RABH1a-like [Camelina sativa]